jgi:hypothetical protein
MVDSRPACAWKIERLTNYSSVNRSQSGLVFGVFTARQNFRLPARSQLADDADKVVSPVYQ